MPEVLKAGKQARHDSTIERPAKKISMTDGYAEEQKTDEEKASAQVSATETPEEEAPAENAQEETNESAASAEVEEESTGPETDEKA